jgi:hypothetical protein
MMKEAFDDDEAPEMDFHLPDDFNWTQLPDDPAEGAAFEEEPDNFKFVLNYILNCIRNSYSHSTSG